MFAVGGRGRLLVEGIVVFAGSPHQVVIIEGKKHMLTVNDEYKRNRRPLNFRAWNG